MPAPAPMTTTLWTGEVALGARCWGDVHAPTAVPTLLVHGLASNARVWDEVAVALATSHGRRPVIAVDLRGHGSSADVPDPPEADPTEVAAADLAGLCAGLGWGSVTVAGQSWGGNIALRLAVDRPALVAGLALVDGGWLHPGDRWATIDEAWPTMRPPDLSGWSLTGISDLLAEAHPDWSPAGLAATLGNLREHPDGSVSPWLTMARHRERAASLLRQRPRELYPRVRCRSVLLAAGDPPDAAALEARAALPAATLLAFAGGDHDLHVQFPARVAAAIDDVAP